MPEITRKHLLVRGRVQGVGFRYTCAAVARSASVRGWIRNLPDGTVEAVAEGARDDVAGVVEWCRKGPDGASVFSVDVEEEVPQGLTGFEIR
ncbi:acylphosphatase [Humibacter sp.]|jgi:acylphosphatase|uniref:acylphosphatase n=1 Tax=Humibacter sp. TaxID=1940291 RepID=UPI002C402B6E|nr:acylphosphatase [Humibacter sp.]HVX07932.1 acylphosphatase [Humibacter sp.]